MQDEPGAGGCFAYKMSLKEGSAMLGIDHQSGAKTGDEPGGDAGLLVRQRGSALPRREKRGSLRVGKRVPAGAGMGEVGTPGAGCGAALHGEADRAEPGADHAPDRAIRAGRRSAA